MVFFSCLSVDFSFVPRTVFWFRCLLRWCGCFCFSVFISMLLTDKYCNPTASGSANHLNSTASGGPSPAGGAADNVSVSNPFDDVSPSPPPRGGPFPSGPHPPYPTSRSKTILSREMLQFNVSRYPSATTWRSELFRSTGLSISRPRTWSKCSARSVFCIFKHSGWLLFFFF